MAYVSNRLTHWIGRGQSQDDQYSILVHNILQKKELRYSYNDWHFGSKYGYVVNHKIPMICFTDIPFSESSNHCQKYSQFGVSFDKAYLANCLACPVGYVQHPFLHANYVHIYHGIRSLMKVLRKTGIESWPNLTTETNIAKTYTLDDILSRFHYMMTFKENYSIEEFHYNERPDPLPGQELFFEKPDALYFEREWRMVLSDSARDLPWHVQHSGYTFFKFDERFLGPIIMPREYVNKIKREKADVFSGYQNDYVPLIVAFEDLIYF